MEGLFLVQHGMDAYSTDVFHGSTLLLGIYGIVPDEWRMGVFMVVQGAVALALREYVKCMEIC